MRARPTALLLATALGLASCNRGSAVSAPPAGPQLPPLQLRPQLPELKALAARHQPPAEPVQKELRDLAELALHLVQADERTHGRAERALREHPAAWFVLEPALVHDDIAVRRRAAWLCGESKQTVLQLPLLLRLKYEADADTVLWVADALQKLGNDTGLAWLDAGIARADTAEAAGQLAIGALRARSVELDEQPTWEAIRGHLQRLHAQWLQRGTPSLPDLHAPDAAQLEARLAAHLITPEGWQLRPVDDARWVMRLAGVLAVPMLSRALATDQHYIRTMPLQVLAELGPVAIGAADAILPLLADPMTGAYAVRALGAIGARQHLPFVRPLLEHQDSELRTAAAIALGNLRDEPSKPALRTKLQASGETMDVRVGAAFALRCFGTDAEAEAFLAERASKGDYHEPILTRLREQLAALDQAASSGR
jgi:HEAT repeat protein